MPLLGNYRVHAALILPRYFHPFLHILCSQWRNVEYKSVFRSRCKLEAMYAEVNYDGKCLHVAKLHTITSVYQWVVPYLYPNIFIQLLFD